jgi:hypothetical protein
MYSVTVLFVNAFILSNRLRWWPHSCCPLRRVTHADTKVKANRWLPQHDGRCHFPRSARGTRGIITKIGFECSELYVLSQTVLRCLRDLLFLSPAALFPSFHKLYFLHRRILLPLLSSQCWTDQCFLHSSDFLYACARWLMCGLQLKATRVTTSWARLFIGENGLREHVTSAFWCYVKRHAADCLTLTAKAVRVLVCQFQSYLIHDLLVVGDPRSDCSLIPTCRMSHKL